MAESEDKAANRPKKSEEEIMEETGDYRIVGKNPFISPVPLKALEHYRLVYSSDSGRLQPDVGVIPEVKIFEYIK